MQDKVLCPICNGQSIKNDSLKIRNSIASIYICSDKNCSLCFLDTWNNKDYVNQLYVNDEYIFEHKIDKNEEKNMKFNEYLSYIDFVTPFLSQEKSLLDIGCGDGKFLELVKQKVKFAEGIELAPSQVSKVQEMGFKCYDKMVGDLKPSFQYDIVTMFALLEHVPFVRNFLDNLKLFIHAKSDIFIVVPNLYDPLISSYNVKEFNEFYYRDVHLYYFTPKSVRKLFTEIGYNVSIKTVQQASITNHFHWINKKEPQKNSNEMSGISLPANINKESKIFEIMNMVDDYYRDLINRNELGDLIYIHATLKS